MKLDKAEILINKLGLEKHPEGGWFREIYRSKEETKKTHLPERFSGSRNHSTSIYFLLTSGEFSAFHRIKSDEVWHFYEGSPLTFHMIEGTGECRSVILGRDIDKGEIYQYVIPHGVWFAAEVNDTDSYTLVGCTVSPGFHFDDFELGARAELINEYPAHKKLIGKFTT